MVRLSRNRCWESLETAKSGAISRLTEVEDGPVQCETNTLERRFKQIELLERMRSREV
jgi:hypothetical protein